MNSGPKITHILCGDVIQSKHRHDFVTCKCGELSVDGGGEYIKLSGDLDNIKWEAVDAQDV